MNHPVEAAQIISAVGFAFYGTGCLTLSRMRTEFERFRVPQLRKATGALQITASVGLILGLWLPPLALAAALGLCVMMLCAMWVRLRINDPVTGFLQAFGCFVLNLGIVWVRSLELF
jgi:hypothetical protein